VLDKQENFIDEKKNNVVLHLVSEGPLIANVFEPSEACTLGLAK